ncbi:GGDEF domain-containing protein [Massilia arenosa]|uniref:diguanylate cyclase n=1 Tax=Zemynaea arenosa TaxID=2561931 RepID=A0A4Y9SD28_9BURK|nr:GGDEF domain-containing protein [Massilia arenosa]TFW20605.1 GGDEF domain-containing protein [Massilia arenosa]
MSKKIALGWAATVVLSAWLSAAHAAGPSADELVLNAREHGYVSPVTAAAALERAASAAPQAHPGPLHATLAALHIAADDAPGVARDLAFLRTQGCTGCADWALLREAQWAVRRQDKPAAVALLPRVAALASARDPDLQQMSYYLQAAIADQQSDHARAIDLALRALRLAEATGNAAEQARTLNMLTLASTNRRDLDRAEAWAAEGYALAEKIGFIYVMAYIRTNQAWIYALRGDAARERQALLDVMRITESHAGLDDARMINSVNLAEYYLKVHRYAEAEAAARDAIAQATRQKKDTAHGVALVALGNAQLHTHPAQGLATLEGAVAHLGRDGPTNWQVDAYEALAAGYEKLGQLQRALDTLHKLARIKDELQARDRGRALAEAQARFQAERKDRQIERLSLDNARRQAELAARSWEQRVWIALAAALAVGGAGLAFAIFAQRARNRLLEAANRHLRDASEHDALTGAGNRRYSARLLERLQARAAAEPEARWAVVLLDIDHFKRVNDQHGHGAGDSVLKQVAQRLQGLVREGDAVIRWGGEEFLLVLDHATPALLRQLCARILGAVADTPMQAEGETLPVTVSLGASLYPMYPGQSWEELLHLIDSALYRAKHAGRNRAVVLEHGGRRARSTVWPDLDAALGQELLSAVTVMGPERLREVVAGPIFVSSWQ